MSALRTHPQKWLEDLLDLGSEWFEYTAALSQETPSAGDEVVTGLGSVSGKRVGIIAHNNLVDHGYISSRGAHKILKMMDLCEELGIPIVSLMASPGVSIREGLLAGDGYARILRKTCQLSGIIPQICGVMGVNIGGPAYSATLQDVVVFNRLRSHMMVSAPNVVKSVLGQETTLGELGGAQTHSEITGLAHFVEANVKSQLDRIRSLIQFFPSHYLQEPKLQQEIESEPLMDLPANFLQPYSMSKFVRSVLDKAEIHEYNSQFGRSVTAIWGYLIGQPVGILACNPEFLAGSLNVESSEKAARFIRLCDAYNLPLINLIDTPGFMPGVSEEHRGLLKSGARLCRSMQTRVPRVSVVLRKNYGAAAIILTQTLGWGGDLVLALENSSCAIMGFDAAQQAIYGLENFSEDQIAQLRARYAVEYENPKNAYSHGLIDQLITLPELRSTLANHIKVLLEKRDKKQSPTRGIEP